MEGNTIGRSQFVATLGLGTVPIFGGRHAIPDIGHPCALAKTETKGYIARHNVVLGTSLSHCFDMHGGRDRKDNTNVAGTSIEIYNNTFWRPEKAIGIRGEPEGYCKVYQNWFPKYQEAGEAIYGLSAKTVAQNPAGSLRPALSGEHC